MKKILFLNTLLLLFFVQEAKCDRIFFNGDTITINAASFLNKYPGFGALKSKLINYKNGCYNAEWTIMGGQLYLTNIYSCKPNIKENINAAFHVTNGMVKAGWVTTDFWFPVGEPIHYHNNTIAIYKAETNVSIVDGKMATKRFNYNYSRESIYNRDPYARAKFIKEHINWRNVPHGKDVKVAFVTQTGTSGKASVMKQIHIQGAPPHSSLYDIEAKRVISLLPVGIYYRHGKVFREELIIEIMFNSSRTQLVTRQTGA